MRPGRVALRTRTGPNAERTPQLGLHSIRCPKSFHRIRTRERSSEDTRSVRCDSGQDASLPSMCRLRTCKRALYHTSIPPRFRILHWVDARARRFLSCMRASTRASPDRCLRTVGWRTVHHAPYTTPSPQIRRGRWPLPIRCDLCNRYDRA